MKTIFRSIPIGVPNKNGRIYPEDMMRKAIEEYNTIPNKQLGQLNHPDNASDIVSLKNATHSIKSVKLKALKVPRKMKKEMKKNGTYSNAKQMSVEIKYYPAAQKIKEILHELVLGPSMEAVLNSDGSPNVKRIISFNFIPKKDSAFKKYL